MDKHKNLKMWRKYLKTSLKIVKEFLTYLRQNFGKKFDGKFISVKLVADSIKYVSSQIPSLFKKTCLPNWRKLLQQKIHQNNASSTIFYQNFRQKLFWWTVSLSENSIRINFDRLKFSSQIITVWSKSRF